MLLGGSGTFGERHSYARGSPFRLWVWVASSDRPFCGRRIIYITIVSLNNVIQHHSLLIFDST